MGDGGELRSVGERIRSASSRSRRAGGGEGVQPDVVQHAAGYYSLRVESSFQLRFSRNFGTDESAVLDYPDGEGSLRSAFRCGVHEESAWREDDGAPVERGGSSAAPLRATPFGASSPPGFTARSVNVKSEIGFLLGE